MSEAHSTARRINCAHLPRPPASAAKPAQAPTIESLSKVIAKGTPRASKMNKLEEAYAQQLEALKHAGRILWWKYEAIGLRLADKTFYHPDFMVLTADGILEIHETKGFMQDDAAVKLKVAASSFPFVFKLVKRAAKKDGGGWLISEV